MQHKITPFLWFNDNAEEAMNYYVSIFKNSKVLSINRYGDAGPGPSGSVMTATFELDGLQFTALNGGPEFGFTEAISFFVCPGKSFPKPWARCWVTRIRRRPAAS